MTQFIKFFTYLSIVVLLMSSCAKKLTETDLPKLPKIKTQELVIKLDSLSKIKPTYFYSKISTHYKDTNNSNSFKTSIRIAKDTAVHAIISFAAIPLVTAKVSTDSILISNKKDKCYIRQSLNYVKETFGVDFDYQNIEELILGMPLGFDSTQKYFQIHNPYQYIISTHKRRALKNEEKLDKEDVSIQYHISKEANSLEGIELYSPSDSTNIKINYNQKERIDVYELPKALNVEIKSPRNRIFIEMNYEKTEVNVPKEMIIVIPDSYEPCK